jgi:hypothetical protein
MPVPFDVAVQHIGGGAPWWLTQEGPAPGALARQLSATSVVRRATWPESESRGVVAPRYAEMGCPMCILPSARRIRDKPPQVMVSLSKGAGCRAIGSARGVHVVPLYDAGQTSGLHASNTSLEGVASSEAS